MQKPVLIFLLAVLVVACSPKPQQPQTIDWRVADLPSIDSVSGAPTRFATPLGDAVHFDGVDDGFYLGENPLRGMSELTIEVILRQQANTAFEQRFLHMGTMGPRIMIETRVNRDSSWYLDTYIRMSREEDLVLIDSLQTHPCDRWYNLAMVVADGRATSYVNGKEQLQGEIAYRPIDEGITSVGVRQNKVCWFAGDLYRIRITPKALRPEEFLQDHEALNNSN